MIVALTVPHVRRTSDAVHLRADHGHVELVSTLPVDQVADVLSAVADALASGDYTVTQVG